MSRSLKVGLAVVVVLVLTGGVLAVRRGGAVVLDAPPVTLDLARPDALVETASLADLPRDLLQVPMFRDVLTEDFVGYYEQSEGRLSLGGTLRRLAYEHDLDLGDWVIRTVIDQPAEIALWQADDGRLGHSLVIVQRTGLTRMLEMAAKVALKDAQLKRVEGDLEVDGTAVPVYALAYARRRVLLFAGHGDRLVILSDAAMLTDRKGRLRGASVVAGLLSARAEAREIYRRHFALESGERRHTLAVGARYLSFGYQRFFPGVTALRFDFARDGWATRVLLDPAALPERALATRTLWSLVPAEPGACVALPVRWQEAATLAEAIGVEAAAVQPVIEALDGPAAVCWYAKSRLYTPLFLVPTRRALEPAEAAVLERMFTAAVGAAEPALSGHADPRYSVGRMEAVEMSMWQRRVTAPDGVRRQGFFQVSLARHRHAVAFSPDDRLVTEAIAVAGRQYPALADVLPEGATVLAVLVPRALGTLAEAEAFASLPAGQEPVFRNAASTRLVPRLAALKTYPAYALVLPADAAPRADRWLAVAWRPLARP
ncbi:MAG TPA: DUF2138 family protein [Methylomirabilota bacterium]|jgi:uncharacterized protein YfaA (DUF2138 family)|nr:DUF2138 family protein [Methylomirabilota bacterium]